VIPINRNAEKHARWQGNKETHPADKSAPLPKGDF